MVKINELRVGNLLSENGKIYELESVDVIPLLKHRKNGISSLKRIPLSALSPISLTPGILKNCGFINNILRTQGDAIITCNELGDQVAFSVNNVWTSTRWFQNVHELQNLYYFVTGEELQINL